ncbi:hypothetical protein F4778DRAFT_781971 [Xylariomycetidae sp. FL2044]|nr:hypothetical protein F4778DRAFT_781971 [Xylariomycetidae sp. FL2044]
MAYASNDNEIVCMKNQSGDPVYRQMDPKREAASRGLVERDLMKFNDNKQVLQLRRWDPRAREMKLDTSTMVVHFNRVSRKTRLYDQRIAWGVYLGPESDYNSNGRIHGDMPQISKLADIQALSKALDVIDAIRAIDEGLSQELRDIKLATDSDYIVKTMCVEAWEWPTTDPYEKEFIAYIDMLETLHERICELEVAGIRVQFWRVTRGKNKDASIVADQTFRAGAAYNVADPENIEHLAEAIKGPGLVERLAGAMDEGEWEEQE